MRHLLGIAAGLLAFAIAWAALSAADAPEPGPRDQEPHAATEFTRTDATSHTNPPTPTTARPGRNPRFAVPPEIGSGESWPLEILVVDALDHAVPGARLRLERADGAGAERLTDEDGWWRGTVGGAAIQVRATHDDIGRSTLVTCEPPTAGSSRRKRLPLLHPVVLRTTVLDRNLQPAADQPVHFEVIWPRNNLQHESVGRTDAQGQCELEVPAGCTCSATAFVDPRPLQDLLGSQDPGEPDDLTDFDALDPKPRATVTAAEGAVLLLIERGAFFVTGKVESTQGSLMEATVRLFSTTGRVVDRTKPDATSGAFRLVAPECGRYVVTAQDRRQQGSTGWVALSMTEPTAATTVTMQPLLPTRGRVTDADGLGIADVEVALAPVGAAAPLQVDAETRSAADGSFELELPKNTRWQLNAAGWRPGPELLAGDRDIVRVYEPPPLREVVLEVWTAEGRPAGRPEGQSWASGLRTHIASAREHRQRRRELQLADHCLLLRDPPAQGRLCITDSHARGQAAWLDFAAMASSRGPVRVQLQPAATLRIEVHNDGKPVRGLTLTVDDGYATNREQVGVHGLVDMPWSTPGPVRLELWRGPECLLTREIELLPAGRETVTLPFRP